MGHAVIRRHDRRCHVLQRLPLEQPQAGRKITAGPAQRQIIGQQALGQAWTDTREIAPVIVIAHAVQREADAQVPDGSQPGFKRARVRISVAPTAGAAQLVIRHVVGPQLTRVIRFLVTKLAAQIDAAFAHERRQKCRIAVGSDVPVVRRVDLNAVDVVHAYRRRQEAGLSFVAERKTERWHHQQRQLHERQQDALRLAHFLFIVNADAGRAQQPGRHPGRAGQTATGGECAVADQRAVLIHEIHAFGFAVPLVLQETVTRIEKEALERLHLEIQRRAFVHVTRAVDAHIAACLGKILGLVVVEPLGTYHHVPAA